MNVANNIMSVGTPPKVEVIDDYFVKETDDWVKVEITAEFMLPKSELKSFIKATQNINAERCRNCSSSDTVIHQRASSKKSFTPSFNGIYNLCRDTAIVYVDRSKMVPMLAKNLTPFIIKGVGSLVLPNYITSILLIRITSEIANVIVSEIFFT